jgi:hypothetical protein
MWWLCFVRNGRFLGVAIVEASSLPAARMRATFDGLGRGGEFSEGHRLGARCTALLTPEDIGRMLSPAEAAALVERFDYKSERKPPAPSRRRRRASAAQAASVDGGLG